MIATSSAIYFATTTGQMLDPEVVVWLSSAILNGVLLGIVLGVFGRATWWVWK